ncbi:hypothetical protein AB670_00982 [Chryseobacterium sp. MOF25P]|uniref:hypothetical protein n=1 Tax=unclassified Chryseobacterium TaxID=2593645 RepID=UPI000805962B|nr:MULTISPECIES: hypothetical protein [unclassified Chryseobacterium]OBW42572.1 hypothetical protein AB670_00982 [Chryseobacterium sp. MOF25P]OBW44822.1 hypothetical protein AB671_03018 [Chryseobacterium sp. BGARF1]
MAPNYNFQEIWNNKNSDIPNIKEIKTKAEKYRKKQILKDIGLIALLLLTVAMIISIWVFIKISFFSTQFGIMLVLIGITMYSFLVYQNINILKKINTSTTNHEYLATIRKVEQQQIYMQTKGLSIYYLLLSFGFAFYFYEFALKMSWLGVLLTYGLTFLWGAVSWFFIRPKQIKKQKEKISTVISSLEKLEKSFEE